MKQLEPNKQMGIGLGNKSALSLTELKTLRKAQRETHQRVEELKMKLFRMTEQHMDQAVNLIRRWMGEK